VSDAPLPARLEYESPPTPDRYKQPMGFWTGAFYGGIYGVALAALGLWSAGTFRSGTLVPLGVVSSPAGLVAVPFVAFMATPVLWAAIGWLLAAYRIGAFRGAFRVVMFCHYATIPFIVFGTAFADWSNLHKAAGSAALASILYAAGQVLIWTAALD
jgi:hypothetical protein